MRLNERAGIPQPPAPATAIQRAPFAIDLAQSGTLRLRLEYLYGAGY